MNEFKPFTVALFNHKTEKYRADPAKNNLNPKAA